MPLPPQMSSQWNRDLISAIDPQMPSEPFTPMELPLPAEQLPSLELSQIGGLPPMPMSNLLSQPMHDLSPTRRDEVAAAPAPVDDLPPFDDFPPLDDSLPFDDLPPVDDLPHAHDLAPAPVDNLPPAPMNNLPPVPMDNLQPAPTHDLISMDDMLDDWPPKDIFLTDDVSLSQDRSSSQVSSSSTPSVVVPSPSAADKADNPVEAGTDSQALGSQDDNWEDISAAEIMLKVGPQKSLGLYEKEWLRFARFLKKDLGSYEPSEEDYLRYFYFRRVAKKMKCSSLWSIHSRVRNCHAVSFISNSLIFIAMLIILFFRGDSQRTSINFQG